MFSNPVPRFHFVLAKVIGSWLGLIIPILIPVLIAMLMLVLYRIPFTAFHWTAFFSFLGISLVYFTFFIILGVFVSTITKKSVISFLVLLVVWVFFVLIFPRVGVMAAGKIVANYGPRLAAAQYPALRAEFFGD